MSAVHVNTVAHCWIPPQYDLTTLLSLAAQGRPQSSPNVRRGVSQQISHCHASLHTNQLHKNTSAQCHSDISWWGRMQLSKCGMLRMQQVKVADIHQLNCANNLHQLLVLAIVCIVFRTPVSARSYRASAFLLDLLLFCQANKFIHSFN